jgi:glycosyltransferase involved in cell wall biosynthesis
MAVTDSTTTTTILSGAKRSGRNPHRRSASISVVIPTLNEAANLPHVLPLIPDFVDEVVLVDGHSEDGTVDVARAIRPDIRVVLQDRRGKGNALACGFAAAEGDIIVMLDADGSTDPNEIPQFVDALLDGSDFAKGSRYAHGGSSLDITPLRAAGNKGLAVAVNLLFRTRYTDLCYGYNAFWRHCLPYMSVTCDGFEVETLIHVRIARAGLTVTEVGSVEHPRLHGESKLNAVSDGIRVLRTIVRERARQHGRGHHDAWRPSFRELAPGDAVPRFEHMRGEGGSRHDVHRHGAVARSELSPSVGSARP